MDLILETGDGMITSLITQSQPIYSMWNFGLLSCDLKNASACNTYISLKNGFLQRIIALPVLIASDVGVTMLNDLESISRWILQQLSAKNKHLTPSNGVWPKSQFVVSLPAVMMSVQYRPHTYFSHKGLLHYLDVTLNLF